MSKAVTLFIPCLVDQLYPEMGIGALQVLRHAGYDVRYHPELTCCGQPAFNAGQRAEARTVAEHFVDTLAQVDAPLVCPSGSCTAMVRHFYPELFAGTGRAAEARLVSDRVVEFATFLVREGADHRLSARHDGLVGFHDSCHGHRELHVGPDTRRLLARVEGAVWADVGEPVCCGFGGLFSVRLPGVARAMSKSRLEAFVERGVRTLVSNDPGCILQLRKECEAFGYELRVLHLTEFLATSLGLSTTSLGAGE